jgi:hypothetical protein
VTLIASGINANINADLMTWLTPAFARDAIARRAVHGDQLERYQYVAQGMTHAGAIERQREPKARKNGRATRSAT